MATYYDLSKVSVQVVDDDPHMLTLLMNILKTIGIEAISTHKAVATALREIKGRPFDILIVDWAMEPDDGLVMVRALRQPTSPAPFIPIVFLTAYTEQERVLAARDAGVTEVIRKPLSIGELNRKIVSIIESPRPFIRNKTFFGPDRRRTSDANYTGPERRKSESADSAS